MLPSDAIHAGDVTLLPGSRALDLPTYLSWLRDPETTRFLEVDSDEVSEEYARSWLQEMEASKVDAVFVISHSTLGSVGTIRLGPINWSARESRIGLMIGDSSARGHGVAQQSIRALSSWAAESGINLLWAGIRSGNVASIRAFEAVGFLKCASELTSAWLPPEWTANSDILIYKRIARGSDW